MQSVLVTGGAGFIGRHLIMRLSQDYQVTIIDNLSSGKNSNISNDQNIATYRNDIRDKETISDIIKREKVDSCIHLAAKVSVRAKDEIETMSTNVDGTLSLLNACAENNIKNFVFASSAAVYGHARVLPVSENHPLNPISKYGLSKVDGERLVSSFRQSNKIQNAVCLRFFNIYGDGQNPEYAGVITKFAEQLAKNMPPIIFGDGEQTRDFISVHDAIDAIIISTKLGISGTFNIGTGQATKIKELAAKMIELAGVDIEPAYEDRNMDNEIRLSVADTTKAKERLGFTAKDNLDDALGKLIHFD